MGKFPYGFNQSVSGIDLLDSQLAANFRKAETEAGAQAKATVVQTNLDAHIADTSDAHDASAVSVTPSGLIVCTTNVQSALVKLEQGIDDLRGEFEGHQHTGRKVPLTYSGTWADYGLGFQSGYYVAYPNGLVVLGGLVKRTGSSGATIATLPAGVRPSGTVDFPAPRSSPAGAILNLAADGTLSLASADPGAAFTFITLDSFSFHAA